MNLNNSANRLTEALEQEKQDRRRRIEQLPDQSSLANLAVCAYDAKKQAEEAERRRVAEEQQRLRASFIQHAERGIAALATRLFAEHLALPADSLLLHELDWKFAPDTFKNATFKETEAGSRAISVEGAGPDWEMLTTIDGVQIQARLSNISAGSAYLILSAKVAGGSQGITTLELLGEVITQERLRRQEQNAEGESA